MMLHLTTPNVKGDAVKAAQVLLANNRFGEFYRGAIDGQFGPLAAQACTRAKKVLGYKLQDCKPFYGSDLEGYLDGTKKLTPAMKARRVKRHEKPRPVTLGDRIFTEAEKHVGTHESPAGSNLNPFGAWYGANGVPWCAEFVSFCAHTVGSKFRYAYVPYVVADAKGHRNGLRILSHSEVQRGDAVCFDWPGESPGVADHIGLFDEWIDATTFRTIEGNTSSDAAGDQSNGGEVCRKERSVTDVQAFVRIS